MNCYSISRILKNDFITHRYNPRFIRKEFIPKIKVYTDHRANNYASVLNRLPTILPNIYIRSYKEVPDGLMNNNRGKFLVWYIDGNESITLKDRLDKNSQYIINNDDDEGYLYISKPSHPYIGSGKYIEIGTLDKLEKRPKVKFQDEYLNFIIQPLISRKLILWEKMFKFDLRLYAAIYKTKDGKFNYYSHPYGVARLALYPYDPFNDYSSAITNISIQEKLPGYTTKKTLKLVNDDLKIGKAILDDIKNKNLFTGDGLKDNQLLILGLDVLLLNDASFRVIEINKDAYLTADLDPNNMETVACQSFIMNVFGKIIPEMKKS